MANDTRATDQERIHALYRAALDADACYSRTLDTFGASRWEARAVRMARSAREQFLITQAYHAKVDADRAYNEAVIAHRSARGEV